MQSLDEILKLVIKWENDLDKYYSKLDKSLKDKRSKITVEALKERLDNNLKILNKIKISDYKKTEFIKNLPDYKSEGFIAKMKIGKDSTPREVFDQILKFEEKLKEFYTHIRDVVVYTKSKDLFDMMVQFKMGQIKEIKGLMDNYDLAI
ncbi:MAG TPA: hypothetical protein DD723_10310 [Candidatus Omnitrophica bacterium]|uniref:Uncharacterized protein n=1 Tax=Candidatus Kaiserbacteria bacterium GW2011_GWA2_49_19 TaxID=1618669 RepID=A0A0G1VPI8_9BACT|nr:MAG: hypothetical protein UY44_C0011G0012 [Candidatus Kaiserbacteria bacterium GW2011_GWA2_49_19]HBR15909.1 hypothetical protein [Candidatus Omnitrophota bacterium]